KLLWLVVPLPLLGALLSAIAYKRAVAPAYRGRFTAAGTLFVHGIHLALLALALAYSATTEPANRLRCAANLHHVGRSLVFYAMKSDAHFPPALDLLIVHGDAPP